VAKKGIVLIGMAGVGKSTIGAALAEALGFDFVDLDKLIRAEQEKTIQQIVDDEGEAALIELEKKGMYRIDLERMVISPGGSIIYDSEVMEYLKRSSILIFLDDTLENIEKRLGNALTRGIVGLKTMTLKEIYDERRPLYSRYADFTASIRGKSTEEVVSEILASNLISY
jgi:shikimate kinase